MNHLEGVRFLFQIAALLFTALLFGQIARWFKCPAVLGELVGGILLGPTLLGHVQPGIHEWLCPIDGPLAIGRAAVAKLGLLSFLFAAGLELDLSQVRKNQRTVAVTSFLGILVPFAVGYA